MPYRTEPAVPVTPRRNIWPEAPSRVAPGILFCSQVAPPSLLAISASVTSRPLSRLIEERSP